MIECRRRQAVGESGERQQSDQVTVSTLQIFAAGNKLAGDILDGGQPINGLTFQFKVECLHAATAVDDDFDGDPFGIGDCLFATFLGSGQCHNHQPSPGSEDRWNPAIAVASCGEARPRFASN